MSERQEALGRAEIENGRDTTPRFLPRHDPGLAGHRQVHVRVDERGHEDQPTRVHQLGAARGRHRLAGDLRAFDAKGAFAWRGVR